MEYVIREMRKDEYPLLGDFLYEAVFVPSGAEKPKRDIVNLPELRIYIDRFGEFKDDFALAAEVNGKIIGAVWVRIMNDYGHVDDKIPSLAISLFEEYRGLGIGSVMMKKMLSLLKTHGYEYVSLSVQKANYAAKMYRKIGFKSVKENSEEYIMLCEL